MAKDNHNHIILADIDSMIAAAKAKGVKEFSITEHVSQFREPRNAIDFGSIHHDGRIFDSLKEYRAEFSKIDDAGIKIRRGLEVDFSPRYEKRVADYVNQESYDVLLCSVHELEDRTDVQRPKSGDQKKMWREYLKLETRALESDFIPFDVLTHPIRMAQGAKERPDELDDLLLDLAMAAKKKGRALELNGSDLNIAADLVKKLALSCSKAGCKVSLGSDAHHPSEVFRNMAKAASLAEELGLDIL